MTDEEDRRAGATSGIFRKISIDMHYDERYLALSPVLPSGRSLWHHLIFGPHTTQIPGLSRIGRAALAEELGWDAEAFGEAFREVFDQGMAEADWEARVVWLPKAIRHNHPASPNVVRGWRRQWSAIPDCPLKSQAWGVLRDELSSIGPGYLKAFDEACPKPSGKPYPKPSPNQRAVSSEQREEEPSDREEPIQVYNPGGEPSPAHVAHDAHGPEPAYAHVCEADPPADSEQALDGEILPPSPGVATALKASGSRTKPTGNDDFDAWYRAYPRRVDPVDARKAFERVIRERRATATDLLAGAMRYAAERDGQDPAFTKHPATWLNKGSWLSERAPPPPTKKTQAEIWVAAAREPSAHEVQLAALAGVFGVLDPNEGTA